MAINDDVKMVAVPEQEVDKNVGFFTGTITIPAGAAGTEGIVRVPHGLGQALLAEGMFSNLSDNTYNPPNYQSITSINLACDATDIIFSYYKLTTHAGPVTYWVRLIAL